MLTDREIAVALAAAKRWPRGKGYWFLWGLPGWDACDLIDIHEAVAMLKENPGLAEYG